MSVFRLWSLCLWGLLGVLPLQALAAASSPRMERVAQCSWDRPGHNPFVGDVVASIDRYTDIPTPVRVRLKERMRAREYDDMVDIRRDSIRGKQEYGSEIRDMHFGLDRVCRQVTRTRWSESAHERGLVYCESEHCILVPTVCRNVSRIDRKPAQVAAALLQAPPAASREAPLGSSAADGTAGAAAAPLPPERAAPVTSSFAEAVAGVTAPLFPSGAEGGVPLGLGAPADGPPALPVGPLAPAAAGEPGDIAGPAFPPPLFGPGGGGVLVPVTVVPPGGGGGGGGGVVEPPVAAIPEPATWASLAAGLLLLALVKRQRRAGVPKCATQKRS